MKVQVRLETGGRRGKQVTVIRGITHNPQVIDGLLKQLKTSLGAGGTVKGKVIEIQGDHVKKIKPLLKEQGYLVS